MSTARDLIKGSMRLIGAIATGETPSAAEQADGLYRLNNILDSWSAENLNIYARVRELFLLAVGTQSYTIGLTGTFNTARPKQVHALTIEDESTADKLERPVDIITAEQWAAIPFKLISAPWPTSAYFAGTWPLDTVNLWPVPSATNKLVIYSTKALTAIASANDDIDFPPGYFEALEYELALRLAPEYGKQADPMVMQRAQESKANIKRANITPQYLNASAQIPAGSNGGLSRTRFLSGDF